MKLKSLVTLVLILFISLSAGAAKILIPMDSTGQTNHLKAYGVAFAAMQQGIKVDWLLNYKGGSFAMDEDSLIAKMCMQRNVTFSTITDQEYNKIVKKITSPSFNGAVVKLEKPPKIAVYTPNNKMPWDDAVTLALTYAEIPFDKLYADEVLAGDLDKYDWLHLHHEDFTGQYGKFWVSYRDSAWYLNDQKAMEELAKKNGYKKVSQMQLAVVKKIRAFVNSGGNLFAMCSATETFDIALAADGVDICDVVFDGDPVSPDAQRKLNFAKCFAFKDFMVATDPNQYIHSNIDNFSRRIPELYDYFKIVAPSAKLDLVPVMLCQNHTKNIEGFMGKTTAFRKEVIKSNVMILGDRIQTAQRLDSNGVPLQNEYYIQDYEARYIHGESGKGSWTFLGGHDPEDYQHHINDPVTDLARHPNSPGYRLILNNVLFPSVKKIDVPTVVMNSKDHKEAAPVNVAPTPEKGTVKIYPNPANNELVISITSGKVAEVVVTDIAGKEVVKRSFSSSKASINISDLAPGIYLIKVNGAYAGKMVKE